MKYERGTEASKTIKFLKVCENKRLGKRRELQVGISSEEFLVFCPLEQHIIATYHSFSFLLQFQVL